MAKGAKGKSSATSATRKKHAKKHADPESEPAKKKDRGKKKDKKEPRKKVYIPPVKPAPIQPDPLETTGLAHMLPAELLVVLRSFNKKAQITKIRALEDLNAGWVEKAIQEGTDGATAYELVEMLPVWMHHLPALFVNPSRRVRLLAATIHSTLWAIPPVREQLVFFLKETASESQVERIAGSWCISSHDIDRAVASTSSKAFSEAFGEGPIQIALDASLRQSIFEFAEQTALNPDGVYGQLNPIQPFFPSITSPSQSRKGSGRSTPARPVKKAEEEVIRNKADEEEENVQDKKARLRISALGTLSFLLKRMDGLHDSALSLFSNPAFLSCLYPGPNPPWINLDESFGNGQPIVRKAMWDLLQTLTSHHKGHLGSIQNQLSRAMLRSAWVEPDASVQAASWQALLPFLKNFPSAWVVANLAEDEDREEEDSEDEDEYGSEDDAGPSSKGPGPPAKGATNAAFTEFLQFLRTGCGGSPIQGYPIVVIVMSTIPSTTLFSSDFAQLDNFFTSFWEAISSRALSSLNRETTAIAFVSALFETLTFLVRRLAASLSTEDLSVAAEDVDQKMLVLVDSQIRKAWQELLEGNLKVPESHFAKNLSKALAYLQRIKPELYDGAWSTIRDVTAASSKSHPSLVTSFLQGLSQGQSQTEGEDHDALIAELSNEALAAYEDDNALDSGKRLLPDLLNRFKGDLFKDALFVQRLDALLTEKTIKMLETSPALILSIIANWNDDTKVNELWHRILKHIAAPCALRLSILATILEALKHESLPNTLTPPGAVFESVIGDLFKEIMDGPQEASPVKGATLRAVLHRSNVFITSETLLSIFIMITSSLQFEIAQVFVKESDEAIPFPCLTTLLDLVVSVYPSLPPESLSNLDLGGLIVEVFLYANLLPHCLAKDNEKSFALANELWEVWSTSTIILETQRVSVLQSVRGRLKGYIINTSTPRVPLHAVLALLSRRIPELEKESAFDILPSEEDLAPLLANMSPLPIDPSIAVIDPLINPSSTGQPPSSSSFLNDKDGFSPYARGVCALLQFFSENRTLAKKNLWALRHFIALSIYAHDFQSIPGLPCPAFDDRAFGSNRAAQHTLSELVSRVDQLSTYLLISSAEDAEGGGKWRRHAVESLLNDQETSQSQANALGHFVVQVLNDAKNVDAPRETRVLGAVLDHVLDNDMEMADGDLWIQLARKLERTAPETSLTLIYAITQTGVESPKLDRYRNETAASLLGLPPAKANTEGLIALRKLAASAPDPNSDIVFLPPLRAVNAIKACQKWVEGTEGDDEGENGVDEEVENSMLLVFAAIAPILQNDNGKHWEFIFDLVETVLENSSLADNIALVGLARALKLVSMIEDLCETNKGLRAQWEPRKSNILSLIRDLAGTKLDDTQFSSASLPRSVCRELLLEIVQSLPTSLVDHETLGKMCHLIADPSINVQKMAYSMLKTAAERRTEYLVIEAGVGSIGGEPPEEDVGIDIPQPKSKKKKKNKKDKGPQLLPVELVSILQREVGLSSGEGCDGDGTLAGQDIFGWMLGWMLLFDLFNNASFKVKSMYIEQMRNHELVGSHLLPTVIHLLRLDHGLSKAFKIQYWAVEEFFTQHFEPSSEISIPVFAAHLYYRALLCVPSLVNAWVLDCKDRQLSSAITGITSQCFSPLIIQAELAHVRSPEGMAELAGEGLSVKVIGGSATLGGGEVVASYAVDEHQLEIRLRIPGDWPLHRIEVRDERLVGVDEKRWRAWVLAVQQTIWIHNGRIVDGLSLFKKNVTLHFEGLVECAICYSIISVMDNSLPKKPCKTCKNRFHAACLYKWFNTSHSSSCPLCRTNII